MASGPPVVIPSSTGVTAPPFQVGEGLLAYKKRTGIQDANVILKKYQERNLKLSEAARPDNEARQAAIDASLKAGRDAAIQAATKKAWNRALNEVLAETVTRDTIQKVQETAPQISEALSYVPGLNVAAKAFDTASLAFDVGTSFLDIPQYDPDYDQNEQIGYDIGNRFLTYFYAPPVLPPKKRRRFY